MEVHLTPLDVAGLGELLEAAVVGADPAEVMPAPPGAVWDDDRRAGFLAFHRERGLAPDPVERTWVIRVDGRAAGALRLEPVPAGAELGIWLGRTHRGRGVAVRAVRILLTDRSVVAPGAPLVARTTAANRGALALLRALGAVTAPGTDGVVTARLRTDDHG